MKRIFFLSMIGMLILGGCSSSEQPSYSPDRRASTEAYPGDAIPSAIEKAKDVGSEATDKAKDTSESIESLQ